MDASTEMGPQSHELQYRILVDRIKELQALGGTVLAPTPLPADAGGGLYLAPTLVTGTRAGGLVVAEGLNGMHLTCGDCRLRHERLHDRVVWTTGNGARV